MNHIKKLIVPLILTLIVTACASSPIKKSFVLTTDTQNIANHRATLPSLMISQVRSTNRLTNDMFYSRSVNEVESFTKSDWISPPPQMLQAAITQNLEARNLFQYVIMAPNSVSAQYRLDLTIIRMMQYFDEATQQSHIELRVQARLINNSNNRIVKSFSYHKNEPSLTYNAEGGVAAYNRALQAIADELTHNLTQALR